MLSPTIYPEHLFPLTLPYAIKQIERSNLELVKAFQEIPDRYLQRRGITNIGYALEEKIGFRLQYPLMESCGIRRIHAV